jgi:hypothetical protein
MYLTGEEFTNEFLTALRTNKLDSFRRKLRDLDLLVIDDVHFLAGKRATQEEFLHTFNAIEAMGRPGRHGFGRAPEDDRGVRRVAGEPFRVRDGRAHRPAELRDALRDPSGAGIAQRAAV